MASSEQHMRLAEKVGVTMEQLTTILINSAQQQQAQTNIGRPVNHYESPISSQNPDFMSPPPSPAVTEKSINKVNQQQPPQNQQNCFSVTDMTPLRAPAEYYEEMEETDEINDREYAMIAERERMLETLRAQQEQEQRKRLKEKDTTRRKIVSSSSKSVPSTSTATEREIDLEMLIELVKSYPCLWNTRLSSNKEFEKRKNAWDQVSINLDDCAHQVECLKKIWKGLRDNFKRCNDRHEKATRSGAAASTLPTCTFFKNLQFLKDSVTAKETITNIDRESPENNDGNIDFDSPTLPEPNTVTEQREENSGNKTSKKRRKSNPVNEVDTMIIESLKSVSNERSSDHDENDSDVLFCRSLITRLKGLLKKKNCMVRIKIEELLFKLEFDEE